MNLRFGSLKLIFGEDDRGIFSSEMKTSWASTSDTLVQTLFLEISMCKKFTMKWSKPIFHYDFA